MVAKPTYLAFLKAINPSEFQWIQYVGLEVNPRGLFFKFKSSQNSLSFTTYAGVNINDTEELLMGRSDEVYEYFKALKLEHGGYPSKTFVKDPIYKLVFENQSIDSALEYEVARETLVYLFLRAKGGDPFTTFRVHKRTLNVKAIKVGECGYSWAMPSAVRLAKIN